MQIDTKVFERIVVEAKQEERKKAIRKVADVMKWATRFAHMNTSDLLYCAEYLYDVDDCKT